MKNIFLKLYVLMLGVVLASCLEDDKYALDPEGSQNVIEFLDPSVPASPAGSIYPAYATSYTLAPEAEFAIQVSYSGPQDDNGNNIELQLAVDPVALATYNKHMTEGLYGDAALNGSTYELMPEENYVMETSTVTIPSGKKSAPFTIKVFPEKFDFTKNYAIPLRIVSASHGTLSEHFSVGILAIGVRNIYDGIYEIVGGSITRNSATGPDAVLGGTYVPDLTIDLSTLASNVLAISPVWRDGSPVGGIDGTSLTIDEATNMVTVKSSTNATLKNTPAATNSYDPATKTFTLNFDWGNAPNTRIIADLQLVYVGPRP
jgi:hypothetical protein